MQILLACAKNMTTRPELSPSILTKPKFLEEAERHALQLAAFTEAELGKALKCNPRLAILNKLRYLSFFDSDDSGPAVLSYNGIVYRTSAPGNLQKPIMPTPTTICGFAPFYMACSGLWTGSKTTV